MPSQRPSPEIEIRYLTKDDIPLLRSLWDQAGLKTRPEGRDHPDRLAAEIIQYPRNFMGAFEGTRLLAALIATWDGRRGWINRLAVLPERRRQNLATRLIASAEAELRSRGALVIAALVEVENRPSLSLFARAGYKDHPKAVFLSKRDGPDV